MGAMTEFESELACVALQAGWRKHDQGGPWLVFAVQTADARRMATPAPRAARHWNAVAAGSLDEVLQQLEARAARCEAGSLRLRGKEVRAGAYVARAVVALLEVRAALVEDGEAPGGTARTWVFRKGLASDMFAFFRILRDLRDVPHWPGRFIRMAQPWQVRR